MEETAPGLVSNLWLEEFRQSLLNEEILRSFPKPTCNWLGRLQPAMILLDLYPLFCHPHLLEVGVGTFTQESCGHPWWPALLLIDTHFSESGDFFLVSGVLNSVSVKCGSRPGLAMGTRLLQRLQRSLRVSSVSESTFKFSLHLTLNDPLSREFLVRNHVSSENCHLCPVSFQHLVLLRSQISV